MTHKANTHVVVNEFDLLQKVANWKIFMVWIRSMLFIKMTYGYALVEPQLISAFRSLTSNSVLCFLLSLYVIQCKKRCICFLVIHMKIESIDNFYGNEEILLIIKKRIFCLLL